MLAHRDHRSRSEEHTALSRNCCCSFERGCLRFVVDLESRDLGLGSDDGGEDEVVIETCCVLNGI